MEIVHLFSKCNKGLPPPPPAQLSRHHLPMVCGVWIPARDVNPGPTSLQLCKG